MIKKLILPTNDSGIILLELLIVLMIIGLLMTGAVRTWDVVVTESRFNETKKEMDQLVYAIVGNADLFTEGRRTDFGFVGDMGRLPDSLVELVRQPDASTTWRGPYIKVKFAENPDDYLADAWGNNYIYDKDSLIIRSYTTGSILTPQSWINRYIAKSENYLLRNTVSGFVKDLIGNPPGPLNDSITVNITYPVLPGVPWTKSITPLPNGSYQLVDIPQGNHSMFVIYDNPPLVDTVEKYACVYPGIANTVDFRMTVRF